MFSVQSSHSTAIFAFDPHDEVVIQGTAYRPLERRPEGYIFQRTDASGLAEVFDHGKLGHLVQKGQLVHNVGAFLPEEARRRLASTTCLISAAPDAVSHRSKLRLAYVEAFLDLEALGMVKRTDEAIKAAMPRLRERATEILGLGEASSDRNVVMLPKKVSTARSAAGSVRTRTWVWRGFSMPIAGLAAGCAGSAWKS